MCQYCEMPVLKVYGEKAAQDVLENLCLQIVEHVS